VVNLLGHDLLGSCRISAKKIVGGSDVQHELGLGLVALASVSEFDVKKMFFKRKESPEAIKRYQLIFIA